MTRYYVECLDCYFRDETIIDHQAAFECAKNHAGYYKHMVTVSVETSHIIGIFKSKNEVKG